MAHWCGGDSGGGSGDGGNSGGGGGGDGGGLWDRGDESRSPTCADDPLPVHSAYTAKL